MKLFPSITTIPIVVAGIMTGVSVTDAATVGSSIVFSGSVFGSLTQMDYIDPAIAPLAPSPNVEGSFQVLDATGSFSPALTVPASIGTIRDFSSGGFPGVITRAGPFLNGSDDPNFYIPNFLRLTVPGSVDFTFRLETVIRSVVIDPNSDPLDPTISSISATLTGTVTDLITNEVQAAVGTFIPEIPRIVKRVRLLPIISSDLLPTRDRYKLLPRRHPKAYQNLESTLA